MINLKSLMNVFGKRSYLQGIFTYNILLKRAFLRKFSDRDKNFFIFPCVAKPLVNSIFPILSSTSLSPLKCIYWFFLVLSKIFSNDYIVHLQIFNILSIKLSIYISLPYCENCLLHVTVLVDCNPIKKLIKQSLQKKDNIHSVHLAL